MWTHPENLNFSMLYNRCYFVNFFTTFENQCFSFSFCYHREAAILDLRWVLHVPPLDQHLQDPAEVALAPLQRVLPGEPVDALQPVLLHALLHLQSTAHVSYVLIVTVQGRQNLIQLGGFRIFSGFKTPRFRTGGNRILRFCQKMWTDAKDKCKARKTLKNDVLVAKIGVDAAENGPIKLRE